MAKKKALKLLSLPVPQTRDEAQDCLGAIGASQRTIVELSMRMDAEIVAIQEKYAAQAADHVAERDGLLVALHAFAASHREELLVNGLKTVTFATGTICWRTTPPAVTIKGEEDVIKLIKDLDLQKFLRVKTEINREAMLADRPAAEAIKGVTISQREEFFAKPTEAKMELILSGGKVKVAPKEEGAKPKKGKPKAAAE